MSDLLTVSERGDTSTRDDENHIYCECSPDKLLCGLDATGLEEMDPGDWITCVVCLDLDVYVCERCGE